MNRVCAIVLAGLIMLFIACKPGTPSQYIQPDEMEDILVDYYMAQAMAQQANTSQGEREYNTAMYIEAVLKKHGVTKAEFDSSLVYYYTRADRFDAICKRVSERLDEQALTQGASEGEIGKYAQYNATGDTANVWADRTTAILLPMPPYNRWDFAIEERLHVSDGFKERPCIYGGGIRRYCGEPQPAILGDGLGAAASA